MEPYEPENLKFAKEFGKLIFGKIHAPSSTVESMKPSRSSKESESRVYRLPNGKERVISSKPEPKAIKVQNEKARDYWETFRRNVAQKMDTSKKFA